MEWASLCGRRSPDREPSPLTGNTARSRLVFRHFQGCLRPISPSLCHRDSPLGVDRRDPIGVEGQHRGYRGHESIPVRGRESRTRRPVDGGMKCRRASVDRRQGNLVHLESGVGRVSGFASERLARVIGPPRFPLLPERSRSGPGRPRSPGFATWATRRGIEPSLRWAPRSSRICASS